MGLKKWIAAVASSGVIGLAAMGGGVIGLAVIGVTGYNILMEPDKLPDEEEEDIAKVHRLGYGECECNCVYIGEAGDTSGGNSGSAGNGATGSGPITFTGIEDKSNFANSAFYFTKLACDELGVPLWIPYAKNSGEDGGSIFNNTVSWNPATYIGLDANVSTDNIERDSLNDGAAGFFQVEGNSVEEEMKFMHNNPTGYDNILNKAGLDVSKYPGMQSGLTKEHSIGWTNWYDDCTYYPAALINMLEAFKVRKQISIDKHWLDQYDWFQSATDEEKDLLHIYTALTLWNNGMYAIDEGENCYNSNPLFAKFLYAFLDTVRNRYDEFVNTKFPGTYGNSANKGEITDHTAPARWIIKNSTVLTDEEKAAFDAEFKKNGGGNHYKVMLRRFCTYGTVLIYNAMSPLSDQSALNGLAKNGITITGGWSILSEGNTSNLGENNSGGTTSSGGSSGITLDANGISERVENVIYVGDSRFVGMDSYTKKGEDFVVAKVGMGYNWFTSDAMSSIQSIKDANTDVTDWTIVSNLGVNDLHNITNYISKYQEMQNNGDNIVIVSVNPTDKNHNSLNSDIDAFNDKLKGSGLTYIDTNSVLKSDGFETSDGLHYKKDTYIKIWNEINKGLVSNSGGSGGLSSLTRTQGKKINTASNNSDRNSGGTGNLGSSGGSNELGKLVDDPSVNPNKYPLYDNYTFSANKYEYWDTNYEQFWNGSVPDDHPLSTLGDYKDHFINYADADHANTITYEGASPQTVLPGSNAQGLLVPDGLEIVDGRIVMAIPLRVYQEPGDVLNQVLEWAKDESNYVPRSGDPPTLTKADSVTSPAIGLYFDVVLDNGTVIACMAGDAKAAHVKTNAKYPGTYFDDTVSDGYCQYTRHDTKDGQRYSMCILEVCHSNNLRPIQSLVKGHRISSIRSYKINYKSSNYTKYFTEGGSDSSFGLTGGGSTGGAKPGGTGNAALGGTGGGTTTTTNGLNPNDPNWKCDCDIPCEKCMCHDNGVGGPPVGSDGDTVGGGGVSSATLQATPGLPQGLYCDLSGNQLTSEQVWDMFKQANPSGADKYSSGIGIEPLWDITVCDPFTTKFSDTKGIIHYMQGSSTPWGGWSSKLTERYGSGFSGGKDNGVTFGGSACGWTGCAIVASTMLHRYITPPEVIMAAYLSPQLNPEYSGKSFLNLFGGAGYGAMKHDNNGDFWNTLRYKGEKLFSISHSDRIDKTQLDATLDAGGMAIMCITQCRWRPDYTSTGGHYIVIRSKEVINGKDMYYTADGSHHAGTSGDGNIPSDFDEVDRAGKKKISSDQVTYVIPGPGYQKYLDSLSSGGTGGTGNTGNLSNGNGESTTTPDGVTITEHMLSESSRHLADLWKNESGKIPTDAKVFVFKPQNPNGHSVTIDAGHGNNSHPAVSLRTESVFPGLSADQIRSMGSSDTNNKSIGVEGRESKNVFNNSEIEPECTLAVAIKVRDKLLAKGYTVTMTRNLGTQNLSNGTRSVLGCETSEIYIAIHTNGGGGRGVVTFYPGDYYAGQGGGPRPGYTRMLGLDANKAESKRLAQELSYGVHNATPGLPLNGSGTAENVLRIFSYSSKPIALVELGFSDNRSDAQILIEKKEEMAQGIVNGIDKYFGY